VCVFVFISFQANFVLYQINVWYCVIKLMVMMGFVRLSVSWSTENN